MRGITASLLSQFVIGVLAFGDLDSWAMPAAMLSVGLAAAATALSARWGPASARRWSAIGVALWLILAFSAWYDIASGVAAPMLVVQAQRAGLWAWFFCATIATIVGAPETRTGPAIAALSLGALLALIAGTVHSFTGYVADLDAWTSRALSVAPAAFVCVPLGASFLLATRGPLRSDTGNATGA